MVMQRFLVFATLVSSALLLIGSCKDMGNEAPSPPPPHLPPLMVADNSFNLVPGETNTTTVSGGTHPYSIVQNSDSVIVRATIVDTILTIQALTTGNAVIVVGDSGSPQLTDTVRVRVREFAVGQTSFDLIVGDSASTRISGGTSPYLVVSNSNPAIGSATIVDTILTMHALSTGSIVIVIGDSHSPQRTDTVHVTISPVPPVLVSFSAQVQPIFIANCVNAGCHPGNGSPFSLQTGVSYGNLVEVNAITGPCAGDKRVKRSDATASALIKRLEGNCGDRMPLGGNPLPSGQIQLIRDWINQGARNN